MGRGESLATGLRFVGVQAGSTAFEAGPTALLPPVADQHRLWVNVATKQGGFFFWVMTRRSFGVVDAFL